MRFSKGRVVHSIKVHEGIKAFRRIAQAWLARHLAQAAKKAKASESSDVTFQSAIVPAPELRRLGHAATSMWMTRAVTTLSSEYDDEDTDELDLLAPVPGHIALDGDNDALVAMSEQMLQVAEVLLAAAVPYTDHEQIRDEVNEELSAQQKQALRQAYVRFGVATARATMRGYDAMIQVR